MIRTYLDISQLEQFEFLKNKDDNYSSAFKLSLYLIIRCESAECSGIVTEPSCRLCFKKMDR